MKRPLDDWDDDERRALHDVRAELDELRARHRDDPPFELLQAAHAEALPEALQSTSAAHLEQSAWSRALVEGAAGVEASLDGDAERKLLNRIHRSARAAPATTRFWNRSWMPALATAAVLVVMVGVLWRTDPFRPVEERPQPNTQGLPSSGPPAPVFTLPLDKPELKLTVAALVLRSGGRDTGFVDDIAPAFDAYRANDYGDAEKKLAALATRYPKAVEMAFYRGVAQLFLKDAAGAIASLQTARRLDDDSFAPEIAWYLAVAHERAGDWIRARAELETLCKGSGAYAARACEAAARFKQE